LESPTPFWNRRRPFGTADAFFGTADTRKLTLNNPDKVKSSKKHFFHFGFVDNIQK